MKILVINTVPTEKNGITNVIFNYLKVLTEDDFCCDYVSINSPDDVYEKAVRVKGGRIYVLPRSKSNVLSYWWGIRKLIKMNCYDAVHIHGNSHTVALELSAAWLGGCKIRIVHCHNTTCIYPLLHKILFPVFNLLYTHALACGVEAGRWMYGSRPYTVINNGVDTQKFSFDTKKRSNIRRQLCISDEDILIGNVGHFYGKVKNQSFVVTVFNELLKKSLRYKLCLIGDGPQKKEVFEKAKSLSLLDSICFTGNIDNVDEYLNALDFIIMPSLYEGLPLTLVEQQANGLQCFVSDTITHEADKTGNLKFISLEKNEEAWASIIMSATDGMTREDRSMAAIECIRKAGYDINSQAKVLEVFYKKALNG